MTKAIALTSLIVAAVLCMLGNFWFTYGLWPRSWVSFVGFSLASGLISHAINRIIKED